MSILRSTCVIFITSFLLSACSSKQAVVKQEKSGPLQITATTVHSRQIQRTVDSVGTLFPFDEAIISAEIEGRLDQVNVDLGDIVREGQVMVHISDEEQRYLVAQNEAQLRSALERLGLKDEKDRIIDIKLTPDMRRAQAELVDAEQRFNRARELRDQGIGTQQDLDQAQARFQVATATLDATANQTRNLIQEVERFKAVLDLQRKKLRDTTVRAPFNAFVKERQVTVGQFVNSNTPLLTLVKIDPIRLRLDVPERMAPWVNTGQQVEVSVEAFTDRKFSGRISRIAPTVDQQKRTFIVEALIPNPNGQLKPGSYARCRVPTNKMDKVLLVPAKAVNYVLGANKAFVIKDGVIEAREVKIGDHFDQDVEILDGLKLGETIATSELAKLDSGVSVQIQQTVADHKTTPNTAE